MPDPAPTDPNPPIKHVYRIIDACPQQEIQLYHAAATVRAKIGRSNPKAHAYLNQMEPGELLDLVGERVVQRLAERERGYVCPHAAGS